MIGRIFVPLSRAEGVALLHLAEKERRDPRQQAAVIIRSALEKAGLLEPPAPDPPTQPAEVQHEHA
jgi:hypothetical protein